MLFHQNENAVGRDQEREYTRAQRKRDNRPEAKRERRGGTGTPAVERARREQFRVGVGGALVHGAPWIDV
eukprot:3939021-Rhodomonas_salina.2